MVIQDCGIRSKNIDGTADRNTNSSSSLKDIIECPVCFKVPNTGAPIFQCRNGHLICRECYKQLEKCPVCRALLCTNTKIRCLAAEKIIARLSGAGFHNLVKRGNITKKDRQALQNVSHQVGINYN